MGPKARRATKAKKPIAKPSANATRPPSERQKSAKARATTIDRDVALLQAELDGGQHADFPEHPSAAHARTTGQLGAEMEIEENEEEESGEDRQIAYHRTTAATLLADTSQIAHKALEIAYENKAKSAAQEQAIQRLAAENADLKEQLAEKGVPKMMPEAELIEAGVFTQVLKMIMAAFDPAMQGVLSLKRVIPILLQADNPTFRSLGKRLEESAKQSAKSCRLIGAALTAFRAARASKASGDEALMFQFAAHYFGMVQYDAEEEQALDSPLLVPKDLKPDDKHRKETEKRLGIHSKWEALPQPTPATQPTLPGWLGGGQSTFSLGTVFPANSPMFPPGTYTVAVGNGQLNNNNNNRGGNRGRSQWSQDAPTHHTLASAVAPQFQQQPREAPPTSAQGYYNSLAKKGFAGGS